MATGPTHAMSGLLTWSALTALAGDHPLTQLSPQSWTVGAVLATGAALLPDLDHPSATISRTFGPLSQAISTGVNALSAVVYRTTKTAKDAKRDGGHRGLTHTTVFALLAAVITTAVVAGSQKWALPAMMFVFSGLAVRGIIKNWSPKRDALVITGLSVAVTALCLSWINDGQTPPAVCGIAVGIGCIAHCLGDAITEQGCPILWPIPINGKTWFPVGLPKIMRMKTGGKVEMVIIGPIITILSAALSLIALGIAG